MTGAKSIEDIEVYKESLLLTRADFGQFLSISLGSCNEVIALVDIIKINFPKIETDMLKQRYQILSKRIFSFRRNLR